MAEDHPTEFLPIAATELESLVERVRPHLSEADGRLLQALVRTFQHLLTLLEKKSTTLARLRHLIFGPRTEKTQTLFPQPPPGGAASPPGSRAKPKLRGHGRHGVAHYPGAQQVPVPHPTLHDGDACPLCHKGKVSDQKSGPVLRIVAQPIFPAMVFALEKFRCNLCGEVFTAPLPKEAGTQKYDETVGSMLAVLRYGHGMPLHRIATLQANFGVPFPPSTQWGLIEAVAKCAEPVHQRLIGLAAQTPLVHNDDTSMTVLSLKAPRASSDLPEDTLAPQGTAERTGVFTSGIVAQVDTHPVVLFFTGRQHAGENLDRVLQHRAAGLPPPIHMCDGLSRNESEEFEVILSHCLAHARRLFVDVADSFPQECEYVIQTLREVYRHDAHAKAQGLSPQQRLLFHQAHSQKLMDELKQWMSDQFEQKKVEPNSGLGQAITYMTKRWSSLTRFLTVPGAPLDNNVCERALKMAILHRKNSLLYKTQHGADVGDLFMSLIHTCRYAAVNAFDYLTALQKNARRVLENPDQWLPWTYQSTLRADSG